MKDNGLTRAEKRRAWLYAAGIVLTLAALGVLGSWIAGLPLWKETPRLRETNALVTAAAADMDEIEIEAVFDPAARTLDVTQRMTLRNRTGKVQDSLVLRSWTGAYQSLETSPCASEELYAACYPQGFSAGGAVFSAATVNGADTELVWLDDAQTALSLTVPEGWTENAQAAVNLRYRVEIPVCASRFGETDGVWALGNVFPTLAVYEEGAWRTEAYVSVGDPFQSECANWTVRLTMPRGYQAAASGYAEAAMQGDTQTLQWRSEAVRDFALVLSDQWQTAQGMAGDTLVTAYAREKSRAEEMVRYAQQALTVFEAHYGAYLYPSLTLAETDFPFGGMEYPRMAMIGASLTRSGGQSLEWTVAHETAHQWWYAMVGSDSYFQPWQDESLCEYALMDYVGRWYGADARESFRVQRVEAALRTETALTVTPGSPLDYFSNLQEYTLVCYRRGAALWTALETALGKDALDGFLQTYAETYRFRRATRQELIDLLAEYSGQDWSGLMSDYLDTAL